MAAATRLNRTHAALALAAFAGLILVAAPPRAAHAGIGSSCDNTTRTATFALDLAGTSLRVSAGYDDSGSNDQIGYAYKGTDAEGDPFQGSGSCGSNVGESWEDLTIQVGDRADEVRLDAVKPKGLVEDPVPAFVDVSIYGGRGNDLLRGHRGRDDVFGEGGGDVIRVAGGGADQANCGGGNDKAIVKGLDIAVDCEQVVTH